MIALRATSMPPKSSRGSGYVYPNVLAFLTALENDILPLDTTPKTYDNVPLNMPSTFDMVCDDALRLLVVDKIGNPVPTVVS